MNQTLRRWRAFFFLAALEAGAAFLALATVPREAPGYSLARVAMLFILAVFAIAFLLIGARPPGKLIALPLSRIVLAGGVLVIACGTTLFLLRYLDPDALAPFYRRLGILLWYLVVLGMQTIVLMATIQFGFQDRGLDQFRRVLQPTGVALALLLLCLMAVIVTGVGVTPDSAYWGEPGVPVMAWHLALAILGGLGILAGSFRLRRLPHLDGWLSFALWLLALLVWLAVPLNVMQNSFYAPIRPPAYQAYPNSDAGYYDSMAESLLVGHPYQGEVPTRPLYIALLTLLHLLVGERYDLIIAGQTMVLALIPVALYLLASRVHSRAAGVLIALIAIAREWTSLLVGSQTRVSNTKTLLVDLPTMLLMIASCLFFVHWLKRKNVRSAALTGGMFGLLLLLRTQAALILPFLVLTSLLALGSRPRAWFPQLAAFTIATVLTISPWLVHNYLGSGQLAFDAPFQYRIIASQYQYSGNLDIGNVDLEGKGLLASLLAFTLRDPGFVAGFIVNHALATQIGGLLVLPLIEPYNGLFADLNLYWLGWDGTLSWYNFLLIIGYLGIIAFGLGAAWNRCKWVGIAPLGFSIGYSLANGMARFSGWRYDLPADWVWYFYFGIGVTQIMILLLVLLTGRGGAPEKVQSRTERLQASWISSAKVIPVFVLIGAVPWLLEGIAAPRYAGQSASNLRAMIQTAPSIRRLGISAGEFETFLDQPDAVIQMGRVLYPRFFTRGAGLASAHPWPAYAPREFPRLGFLLLNKARHDVVLTTREPPVELVHASDAIVVGCQSGTYIDSRLVLLVDSNLAFQGKALAEPCP